MADIHTFSTMTYPVSVRAGLLAGLLVAHPLVAQGSGELFPEPFLVEHQVVQTDQNGDVYTGDPVVDYYGGSWIVSERAAGSRLVIDLARSELTEIRPAEGVYYSLSFNRFAELRGEMARFEAGFPAEQEIKAALAEPAVEPTFEVTESPGGALGTRAKGLPVAADAFLANPGVRHIRVSLDVSNPGVSGLGLKNAEGETMDVWCDQSVQLTPAALAALERFEQGVLGPPGWLAKKRVNPSLFLATARRRADGAFPVRTARPIDLGVPEAQKSASQAPGKARGTIEDVTLRLEKLEAFPLELVSIPDGLRRIAHPLESMAAFAEKEEERERIMGQSVTAQPISNE